MVSKPNTAKLHILLEEMVTIKLELAQIWCEKRQVGCHYELIHRAKTMLIVNFKQIMRKEIFFPFGNIIAMYMYVLSIA